MPGRLSFDIDDEMAEALDRMIADTNLDFPRELAAAATLRDWLIGAGCLQEDDLEEDTPTERES
jgi:hypothetical protein